MTVAFFAHLAECVNACINYTFDVQMTVHMRRHRLDLDTGVDS